MSLFLSGAMVVAFAPAVAAPLAEAATALSSGDEVNVHFDIDGGDVASGSAYVDGEVSATVTDGTAAINASELGSAVYTKAGYAFAHWWYDADGDGIDDGNTSEDYNGLSDIRLADSVKSGDTVALKAVYNVPAVAAVVAGSGKVTQKAADFTGFTVTPSHTDATNTYQLTVTWTAAGTSEPVEVYKSFNQRFSTANTPYALTFTSDAQQATLGSGKIDAKYYGAGTYEFKIAKTTSATDATPLFTSEAAKFEIASISLGAGAGAYADGKTPSFLAEAGTTYGGFVAANRDAIDALALPAYAISGVPQNFVSFSTAEGAKALTYSATNAANASINDTFAQSWVYNDGTDDSTATYATYAEAEDAATAAGVDSATYKVKVVKTSESGSTSDLIGETTAGAAVTLQYAVADSAPTSATDDAWTTTRPSSVAGSKLFVAMVTGTGDSRSFVGDAAEAVDHSSVGAAWTGSNDIEIKDSTSALTAVYDVPRVEAFSYDRGTKTLSYSAKALAHGTDVEGYKVEISGPNSLSFEIEKAKETGTGVTGVNTTSGTIAGKLVLGQKGYGGADGKVATEPGSGTYTVTITPVYASTATRSGGAVSKTVDLIALTADLGEGKKASGTTGSVAFASGDLTVSNAIAAAVGTYTAPSGMALDYWSTDGAEAGKVADLTAKVTADTALTAVWKQATTRTPTAAVAANGKKFDITPACADEGAKFTYSTAGYSDDDTETDAAAPSGVITVDPNSVKTVSVKAKASTYAASEALALTSAYAAANQVDAKTPSYNAAIAGYATVFKAFLGTGVVDPLGTGKTDADNYYSKTYEKALAEGQKALAANGYMEDGAWTKAANAQVQASVDGVVADAKAEVGKLVEGVAQTDGTTKILPADTAKVVSAQLDALSADLAKAIAKAEEGAAPGLVSGTGRAVAGVASKVADALKSAGAVAETVKTDELAAERALEAYEVALATGTDEEVAAAKKAAEDAVAAVGDTGAKAALQAELDEVNAGQAAGTSAAAVEAAIAALPASPSAADEAAVAAAVAGYEALGDAAKAKVPVASVAALYKAQAAVISAKLSASDGNAAALDAKLAAAQKKLVKASTVKSLKAKSSKKKQLKVTFKANSDLTAIGKTTYQYRVKKGSKAGGSWKTAKTSTTIKKLASKKKYTVQVRAKVTVDGKAVYSKASTKKGVKVK